MVQWYSRLISELHLCILQLKVNVLLRLGRLRRDVGNQKPTSTLSLQIHLLSILKLHIWVSNLGNSAEGTEHSVHLSLTCLNTGAISEGNNHLWSLFNFQRSSADNKFQQTYLRLKMMFLNLKNSVISS